MSSAERVRELRLVFGGLETFAPKEYWAAPGLAKGVPRAAVVELIGACKTEWLILFLKQHLEFRVFWAEDQQRILPTALHQRGLDLSQITFATFGSELTTPLRRVIQSQAYEVIVAPQLFHETKNENKVLKAFQLFTEKSNSTLFLLGQKEASKAWAISLQLKIERAQEEGPDHEWSSFHVEVLKQKHGKLL